MTSRKFRLTWHCPTCDARHELTDELTSVMAAASELLKVGVKLVGIYDEVYALECDLDSAEEITLRHG